MLVTLTPAKDRPYIDGTTDNSAVGQVVGYNFLNRFSSLGVSAKDTGSVSASTMVGTAPARRPGSGQSAKGWGKMLGKKLASQTGWLYPAAGLSAMCGLLRRRGRPRTDPLRAGFLLWTTWLATYFLVFSAGSVGAHTYYMGVVAAPLASLFGAGIVQLWRAWRGGGRAGTWALPTAAVSTVAWSVVIAERFPSFLPWLAPAAVVLGVAAVGLLALSRRPDAGPVRRRTAVLGLGVAIAAMLLPPAAWASSVLDPAYGHSGMGAAGPVTVRTIPKPLKSSAGSGAHAPAALSMSSQERQPGRPGPAETSGSTAHKSPLTAEQRHLLAYARAHQDGSRYLFLTLNWRSASPYILYTDAEVLPVGGFTGAVPSPTRRGFLHLVATGQLRYVVLGGPATTPGTWISPWVREHCVRTDYRPRQLYLCSPASVA
jgi:4-amino-4-deoxy-L-arabinose transferase-like glycosyltransferase